MPSVVVKKIVSLLLVVLIGSASLFSLCQIAHASDHSECTRGVKAAATAVTTEHGCDPALPAGEQRDTDQCDSSCYCTCNLPVTGSPLQFDKKLLIAELTAIEVFTALPEVFLPKFIPPQNLA